MNLAANLFLGISILKQSSTLFWLVLFDALGEVFQENGLLVIFYSLNTL